MRKSSILQQSANKKFNSPFLKPRSTASPAIEKVQQDIDIAATGSDNVVRKRSISDIMNLVNQPRPPQDAVKKVCIEHSRSVIPSPSFGSPHTESSHKSPSAPPTPPKSIGTQLPLSDASGASTNARYYSVVWCKKSMKKHKKWEGDAVLIIKGRSATLRSLEGKELSSAFGYKVKEVDAIEEGSIFSIGGKECEIQASISTEDYLSGRCFSDGFVPAATQEDSKQSSSAPTLSKTQQY